MHQAATLETVKIETASVFRKQNLTEQKIEEAIEPQNAFLSASVEEKSLVYAEAATFALFLVLIITAVCMIAYGAKQIAYGAIQIARVLSELNHNQTVWLFLNGRI